MAGRGTDIMLGGNPEYLAKHEMRRMEFPEEMISEATGFGDTDDEELLHARKTYQELEKKFKAQIKPEAEEVREAGGLFIKMCIRDSVGSGLVAVFVQKLAADLFDLVDGFYHVHRDADGSGLVGDGTGDGLANPPGSIGGKFKALGVVKLFHCLDKAQISFLDQVKNCLLYTSRCV